MVEINQQFFIPTDTEHYTKVLNGDVTAEDVTAYIKNEILTNQLYWNALQLGITKIEVRKE